MPTQGVKNRQTAEKIKGDAHSHPRGKPSYVPRGRGRGGPRGGFRGRFIRRGGGGTRYPSKYLGKEGGDEQQVQINLDIRKILGIFRKMRYFVKIENPILAELAR